MPTVQLVLSDDQRRDAERRARELGFPTLEAYAESLIAADIELPVSEEVERELIQAMKTPAREMTPADWAAKRKELIERYSQAKAG